jgi:hypothetical protein
MSKEEKHLQKPLRKVGEKIRPSLDREPHEQPSLKAVLKFSEKVLYQNQTSLQIEFRETPTKGLQNYIQMRYSQTKFQISETQTKLAGLLKTVSARNMALFALIDRPNRNSKFEKQSMSSIDETHRYGFERTFLPDPKLASQKEEENEKDEWLNMPTRREALFGPNISVVPSRPVSSFHIPVQVPSNKRWISRESRLHNPPTKIDPWFQAPGNMAFGKREPRSAR